MGREAAGEWNCECKFPFPVVEPVLVGPLLGWMGVLGMELDVGDASLAGACVPCAGVFSYTVLSNLR